MTIDFSSRIESGVKEVFPSVPIQKCVFHSVQLLTRGYLKELTRINSEVLGKHIKEWKWLRKKTLELEKDKISNIPSTLKFSDTKEALSIYKKLQSLYSEGTPKEIQQNVSKFFSTSIFCKWNGRPFFLERYQKIFDERKFTYTQKGLKYITSKVYKGWRKAILQLRRKFEEEKRLFNDAKYLILMNPTNMKPFNKRKLRKCLSTFPWLRKYRRTLVRFYYQFRLPAHKRRSLSFLSNILSKDSHPRLKSAIQTLIENEDDMFRFQHFIHPKTNALPSKAIKVVNESINKTINNLYRVQCGMRTLENLQMRISHKLSCPIIVSPTLMDKIDKGTKI